MYTRVWLGGGAGTVGAGESRYNGWTQNPNKKETNTH